MCLWVGRMQTESMIFLLLILIVAFFALAALFGADSRPFDARGRRWV